MKIGDQVWIIDQNNRVYEKGNSSPVFRGYFVKRYIIGETTRSWILGYSEDTRLKMGEKYKKKSSLKSIYVSEQEIDDACWIDGNRYRISQKIYRCSNGEIMKTIDKLLGE